MCIYVCQSGEFSIIGMHGKCTYCTNCFFNYLNCSYEIRRFNDKYWMLKSVIFLSILLLWSICNPSSKLFLHVSRVMWIVTFSRNPNKHAVFQGWVYQLSNNLYHTTSLWCLNGKWIFSEWTPDLQILLELG